MLRWIITLFMVFCGGMTAFSQKTVIVQGYLRDSLSRNPVVFAHVTSLDAGAVVSDSTGYFKLKVRTIPGTIFSLLRSIVPLPAVIKLLAYSGISWE